MDPEIEQLNAELSVEALKAKWNQCYLSDVKENWGSVKSAFQTREYRRQVWRDLRDYARARAMLLPTKQREYWYKLAKLPFSQFTVPEEFDSCDWRCDVKEHELYDYVVHGACHCGSPTQT